jgi:hypothetical protein
MNKKQSFVDKAYKNVPGFDLQLKRLRRSITISGKSQSTFTNDVQTQKTAKNLLQKPY